MKSVIFILLAVVFFSFLVDGAPVGTDSAVKKKLEDYRLKLAQKYQDKLKPAKKYSEGIEAPKVPEIVDKSDVANSEEFHNMPSHELVHINKKVSNELYQGDIALTNDQLDYLLDPNHPRFKRQAYKSASYPNTLWPKTGISYSFASNLTENTKKLIRQAIEFWQTHVCLKFNENGGGTPFLFFYKGTGCWSYIGKVSYMTSQAISIGSGCEHVGIIAHEIGHALGFFHAQSRVDRDDYVKINLDNIDTYYLDNYEKETNQTNDNFGMPYDYGSIMHYSQSSFATNEDIPVIIALESNLYQNTMGNRVTPSFYDIKMMNELYQCEASCPSNGINCYNGGFVNPTNCSECICPTGFGGTLCSARQVASNGSVTCGETLLATESWQYLNRSTGDGTTNIKDDFTSCHWFLVAFDVTKRIEIKINKIGSACSSGCFYGGTEFKLGDYSRTGYRFCCKEDIAKLNGTLKSSDHLVVISSFVRYYRQLFEIQYRRVDQ